MKNTNEIMAEHLALRRSSIYALNLPSNITEALVLNGGIKTVSQLEFRDAATLLDIKGIGVQDVELIKTKLQEMGLEMSDSRLPKPSKVSVKKVEYPGNLLRFIKEHNAKFREPDAVTDDILKGIRFACVSLEDDLQVILYLRFEMHQNLADIAKMFGSSKTLIESKIEKCIEKWFLSGDIKYIEEGLSGRIKNLINKKAEDLAELRLAKEYQRGYDNAVAELKGEEVEPKKPLNILDTPLSDIGYSVRTFHALDRAGVETLGDIVSMTFEDLCKIRNLGRISREEVRSKVREYELVGAFEADFDEKNK